MLGIAASVLLFLIAGILFIPKKEVVKHNHPDSNSVAVNQIKPVVVKPENVNTVTTSDKNEEQVAAVQGPVTHISSSHQLKVIATPVNPKEQEQQVIAKEEPVKPEQQPVLAVLNNRIDENTKPIELEAAPSTIKKADHDATISIPSQPMLASTPVPVDKAAKPMVKKHGIRNFGDLVNLVVAKVDKRKDKLIQFSDSDDDESVISAVHLGALKIKKDN